MTLHSPGPLAGRRPLDVWGACSEPRAGMNIWNIRGAHSLGLSPLKYFLSGRPSELQ